MPRLLRFYCPDLPEAAGSLAELPVSEARHLGSVLRAAIGSTITLFDGRGHSVPATVESLGKSGGTARLLQSAQFSPRARELTLAVAPPKHGLDELVAPLAELGVARIVPITCEHGERRLTASDLEVVRVRVARVAVAASKQSGSDWLIELGDPVEFSDALKSGAASSVAVCDPSGAFQTKAESVVSTILIGPEGGWSGSELTQAKAAEVHLWRLPGNVLRVGTAATVAAALALART